MSVMALLIHTLRISRSGGAFASIDCRFIDTLYSARRTASTSYCLS